MIPHWLRDNLLESDLVGQRVTIRIGSFLIQTRQENPRGLGTELYCKTPNDFQVKIVKTQWQHRLSETVPLIMAESFSWSSQIAVKNIKSYLHL